MSSSKALSTVSPPKPESNTPMVGRRPRSALMHLVSSELADRAYRFSLRDRLSRAAWPRRNRRAVRAGPRVTEEGADFICCLGRKNMLELAGLLLDLRLAVHRKTVGEESVLQTMAPDAA